MPRSHPKRKFVSFIMELVRFYLLGMTPVGAPACDTSLIPG